MLPVLEIVVTSFLLFAVIALIEQVSKLTRAVRYLAKLVDGKGAKGP